ncbi:MULTISPECIES: ACT domain-containing protein [Anaerococcus]|uniref:ACT domain-containing protein n=1 Tax=Anaerococcus TaxID=165779 RepID=UPI0002E6F53E|nr:MULTISPECIES: ACT domain-containing protein [Anaerococcus]
MKAILTVIGNDQEGIIYKISKVLYEYNINILDLSQTIMENQFVGMFNIDFTKSEADFAEIKKAFDKLADANNLEIRIQNEKLFDAMHRI